MQKWLYLIVAIISEVAATSALKSADGFTRFWPSCVVVAGYASAFYFLSLRGHHRKRNLLYVSANSNS